MSKVIILNSSNLVPNSNNSVFNYRFPAGSINFKNDYIAVSQISLYNSVFNITKINNNNIFTYTWVDGSVNNVLFPDGNYELVDINAYMQSIMVSKGHYLLTSSGSYVYLLEIVVNQTRYAYQINSYQISSVIATANTWTLPLSATWVLPTNPINPIFNVLNNSFQSIIGFNYGSYPNSIITGTPPNQTQTPSYTSTQSFLSSNAPQINPTPSYICLCSLVNNKLAIPSQTIFSITPTNISYGSLYNIQVSGELLWIKIEDGTYFNLTFSFVDGNGQTIVFQDPNILVLLVIKNKDEFLIKGGI
jgi:hypothetical protein